MKKPKAYLFFLGVLFFVISRLPAWTQPHMAFRNYSQADGLPSEFINAIFQDSKGLIWLATDKGVSCFDGRSFKNYTTDHGLPSNLIYSIAEDENKQLWVATYRGPAKFCHNQFIQTESDKSIQVIGQLVTDSAGQLYGLSHSKEDGYILLAKNANTGWIRLQTSHGAFVHRIATFSDGRILSNVNSSLCWIHLNNEQLQVTPVKWTAKAKKKLKGVLPSWKDDGSDKLSSSLSIIPLANKKAYLNITYKLLLEIRSDLQDSLHIDNSWDFPYGLCYDFKIYQDQLLLATDKGLQRYNFGSEQHEALPWLNPQHTQCLMEDKQSNLWVGTYGSGVFKSIGNRIKALSLPSEHIGRMISAGDGQVWVAANDGIYLLNTQGEVLATDKNITNVTCMALSPDSLLLIGNYRHIFQYSKKDILAKKTPFLLTTASSGASGLAYDHKKQAWLSTYGIGIHTLKAMMGFNDPNNSHTATMGRGGFMTENIWPSAQGIWGSTNSEGVFLLRGLEDIQLSKQEGLLSNNVHTVFEDSKKRVWIGTDKGVACYDSHRIIQAYGEKEGLVGTKVVLVFEDSQQNIWVLSDQSLHWLEGNRLRALQDIPLKFTSKDQIKNGLFDQKNNLLWLNTGKNAYRINLKGYAPYEYAPPLLLSKLVVDGQAIANGSLLPASTKEICITYSMPDFKEERGNQLLFLLKGYHEDWQQARTSIEDICFNGLRAGKYQLLAKTVGPTGVMSDGSTLASWEIAPFWWDTWWARLLATLFFIGLIAAVVWRISQLRYRKKLQAIALEYQLQVERTRISRELHDHVGSHLSNVILGIDHVNSPMIAVANKKQKLEDVATAARKAMASLREAIWLLHQSSVSAESLFDRVKVYTQGLMFPHVNFTFSEALLQPVSLNSSVGLHVFRIIQEAINNALKHSGCKQLSLAVYMENNHLVWEISDDGHGFTEYITATPSSYGLTNMKHRANEIHATIEWLPLEKGTQVRISVPLK